MNADNDPAAALENGGSGAVPEGGTVESPNKPLLGGVLRWPGVLAAFAWGLGEGTLFFIVPDVIITLAAMLNPRKSLAHVAAVVAGSLIAGAVMYTWSAHNPAAAYHAVDTVPAVTASMFDQTETDFREAGIWGPCRGPTSGVPYKVFAVVAPRHCSLPVFLLVSIPARLERLLISWAQFAVVGWGLRRWRPQWLRAAVWIHPFYWLAIEIVYWMTR